MKLRYGLIKTSLIDYPAKVSAVVFTHGCNFRCPYCHNPELVEGTPPEEFIDREELLRFLDKRKSVLGGVVITGGEPLIHPQIPALCEEIKSRGLSLKVDTNGSFPERLKACAPDFVALDLKTDFSRYPLLLPSATDSERISEAIRETLRYLKESGVAFQLRTTMVPGIVGPEELPEVLAAIERELGESRGRYLLSGFRNHKTLDPSLIERAPYGDVDLYSSAELIERAGFETQVRLNR